MASVYNSLGLYTIKWSENEDNIYLNNKSCWKFSQRSFNNVWFLVRFRQLANIWYNALQISNEYESLQFGKIQHFVQRV
jgi:hypothetical protein